MMTDKQNIIANEIQLHGNTNFITDSGLPDNRQIHVFGDSHAIFYYNSLLILEHWSYGGKLPLTMYSLIHSDINIYDIGAILGNGHEKYPIKPNDFVLFTFGYNDFQRRILEHSTTQLEQNLYTILDKYLDKIKYFEKTYNIIPLIYCIFPNPRAYAQGVNTVNTPEMRQYITKLGNQYLANQCHTRNIMFFDIYEFITDNEGFIKNEYTKDGIHLDYDNQTLHETIDNLLLSECTLYLQTHIC